MQQIRQSIVIKYGQLLGDNKMNIIKTFCTVIVLTLVYILSGCQQPQKAVTSTQSPPTAVTKPCTSTPDPWIYNHHSEWELPGAAVPEIYTAAKTVLLEDWKMPRQGDTRNENQYIDFLSASIKVSSALSTVFDVSIIKLNEKSCRLTIDAKSKQVPPAQLEEHCSLMYDSICKHLDTSPQDNQNKKVIWNNNIKMYAAGIYTFDYPVKNIFDMSIQLLEQMHVSKSNSAYDDFAGQIFFKSGNNFEMAIEVRMADEEKSVLTFFSRDVSDDIIKNWGDIFIQRLRQKLAEPQPEIPTASAPEARAIKNTYYGNNRFPSNVSKTVEYLHSVEKVNSALRDTLQLLNIGLSDNPQQDALTVKVKFNTANSANWQVTISQIAPNQSKVLFWATNIWSEDFEKYTATIIENLEKRLQQVEKSDDIPAAVTTENK